MKFSKGLAAAVVISVSALVAACGGPTSGRVIDKSFAPAHSEWYEHTVSYKPLIMVPEQEYIGPDWSLELEDPNGKTGWVDVSQSTYNKTQVGDEYGGTSGNS